MNPLIHLQLVGARYPFLPQARSWIASMAAKHQIDIEELLDGSMMDRAVCIAFALGANEVELVGFSTDDVGQWSGVTDKKRKLIKLQWMSRVLNILSLRV